MTTQQASPRRWALAIVGFALLSGAAHARDPVDEVDPFIGTMSNLPDPAEPRDNGANGGNTLPGAVRPFGMLYWSPDPADGPYYAYEHPITRGFSLTHLSGVGCGVFGDVAILPVPGALTVSPAIRPAPYTARFVHAHERASPGAYDVTLDDGVAVALSAAVRAGIGTFLFPASGQPRSVIVDLSRALNPVLSAEVAIHGAEISGSVTAGRWCGQENQYRVHFVLEFDHAPEQSGTFDDHGLQPGKDATSGFHVGAYATFAPAEDIVTIRAGLSYTSIEAARANLHAEIPDWSIAAVRASAHAAWAGALGSVAIDGGTAEQRTMAYTALYHALIHPSTYADADGTYLGFDDRPHRAQSREQYANISGWDVYRTQIQLLAMLFPKVASDIAQSLVADAQEGGGLPRWPVANDESNVQVGDPSPAIIAGAYAFGARAFDADAALAAMLRGAHDTAAHSRLYAERPHLDRYLTRGHVFVDPNADEDNFPLLGDLSVSTTLEYAAADFAIAQFAASLGDAAEARALRQRAGTWRTLFDPDTKSLRPRDPDGGFHSPFTPGDAYGFEEGNSAVYSWMVPYDLAGVIAALGGPADATARLDDFFSKHIVGIGGYGGLPYYSSANEPYFLDPYIYNWLGQPARTQATLRQILTRDFSAAPNGLPGNDDLGVMSSWLLFADLGLYPAIPGVGGFTVSTPVFPSVTLHLPGHDLRLRATGPDDAAYLHAVSVDGRPLDRLWLDWDAVAQAREIVFERVAAPDAALPTAPPPSFGPDDR